MHMMKYFVSTAVIVIASATAVPAIACDMHGAGFGAFGNSGANWQPYTPRTYTEDPAFLDQNETDYAALTPLPAQKTRPSFSNAANRAAIAAKSKAAQKAKAERIKNAKKEVVKKADLNSDR